MSLFKKAISIAFVVFFLLPNSRVQASETMLAGNVKSKQGGALSRGSS